MYFVLKWFIFAIWKLFIWYTISEDFLEEQNGKERAGYGKFLLKNLSIKLSEKFGNGFSEENLKLMRRFYGVYSRDKIGETVFTQFDKYPISSDGYTSKFKTISRN